MKLLFSLLFILIISSASAQLELTTSFNSTYSGRNISIILSKTYNEKHEFGGGIRFNINKLEMSDDQNKVFMKRLYATNFSEHLGVTGFYSNKILRHWKHIKPFLFYDVQATYSKTRKHDFIPTIYELDGFSLFTEHINRFGPFTWMEQNIGIGFKADLPGQFFVSQKIGFGGTLILGSEQRLGKEKVTWEFGGIINVGIGYRFK